MSSIEMICERRLRLVDRSARQDVTHVLIDTGVGEELQQLELTERAEAEEGMLEGQDLLNGDLPVGRLVESSNDGAICAFTESVEDLVIVT